MPIEELLKLQKGAHYELWMQYLELWIEGIALALLILLFLSPIWIMYRHHLENLKKGEKEQCQEQKRGWSWQKSQREQK